MKLPTFFGGVHPPEGKELTEGKAIENLMPKGDLVYPMSQHIGAPCAPLVAKGDRVRVGQKIADTDAFVSAPIFASVSGTVKDIALHMTVPGTMDPCIIVENDGQYEKAPSLLDELGHRPKPEEYVKMIRAAGIVGLGGACFPAHVKLSPPEGRVIKWVIVNGAECEPFLNCDNRLMQEEPNDVLGGLRFTLELFPEAKGIIAIEENKPQSIAIMQEKVAALGDPRISVMPHTVKYPQGAEKMLIWSVTGQEIPVGALPADVGCIILNARTSWQINRAITKGRPLTERIISVTGDAVANPKNLRVPLGISIRELVDAAGGFKEPPVKVLAGGPMMGMSMRSLDVPVVKGTSGVLALTANMAHVGAESNCLRCGRCVEACPMRLVPTEMDTAARARNYAEFEALGGMNCIECGCCSYACPASRFLTQNFRAGKAAVMAERRKKAKK